MSECMYSTPVIVYLTLTLHDATCYVHLLTSAQGLVVGIHEVTDCRSELLFQKYLLCGSPPKTQFKVWIHTWIMAYIIAAVSYMTPSRRLGARLSVPNSVWLHKWSTNGARTRMPIALCWQDVNGTHVRGCSHVAKQSIDARRDVCRGIFGLFSLC